MSDRQVQNLESFSKTYGFIRYFYPSRELQNFDWDRFLMHGVEKILRNENEAMEALLHRLFSPICPEIVFSKNEIILTENTIQSPFYIQEHRAIGEFATLFLGNDYTPIRRIEESENRLQFYLYQLQENLFVKFPLAVKELRPRTSEFRNLERELRAVEMRGVRLWHLISRRSQRNANIALHQYVFRIADMIGRWQMIHNFYAYYEEDGLSSTWNKHNKEALRAVASSKNIHEHYDAILRLFANIRDSHVFIAPNITFGGLIGSFIQSFYPELQIGFVDGIGYIANAGAYSEKLQRGDVIKMVNNIPIDEFVAKRLNYIAYSTRAGGFVRLSRDLFRSYHRNSVFTIQVEKADGSRKELQITTNRTRPYFESPTSDFIKTYENGIIYINLTSPSATYENFSRRIADFQQAEGIILDVRGRPHDESLAILSHFITDVVSLGNLLRPIISFPNRKNRQYVEVEKWRIAPATSDFSREFSQKYQYPTPLPIAIDVPVVFLTNASAGSFAETFMEIVKHYRIGTIIGEPTAGCNGDIARIRRPFAIYTFSFNRFKNRDGSRFHGVGVQPDILSVPTLSDIRLGIDTQLQRAKIYLYENRK